ncbi:MAG: Na+/H+ antiporter subunit B [Planctomycetota bacterium]
MKSPILRTAANGILPAMLVLSIIVLLRGHNEPGGGFIGGLLAAAGFSLYALANDSRAARRLLGVSPLVIAGVGMLVAAMSGVIGLIAGEPFLKGLWLSVPVTGFPEPLKIGTPLMFDIGVYLVVIGGVMLMVFSLEEVSDDAPVRR